MRLYLFPYGIQEKTGIPVPGYLIQTAAGQNILIDTGFPESTIGQETPIPGISPTAENMVTHHLAQLGLTPADIDYVVCTHFDWDHAGAHDLFPEAEFIVQKKHYEFATGPDGDRFDLYRPHWDQPDLHYRLIDGNIELAPGVELIETSGHVPGHQSVLVRLPQTGPVLLAIDAIVSTIQIDPETFQPNGADMDPAAALATVEELRQLIKDENIALTICGHDGQQWPTLRHAPAFYE